MYNILNNGYSAGIYDQKWNLVLAESECRFINYSFWRLIEGGYGPLEIAVPKAVKALKKWQRG